MLYLYILYLKNGNLVLFSFNILSSCERIMQEKETFISEFKRVDQIRFGDEIKEKIVTERYSARLIKYGVDEKVRVTERERERKKKIKREREREKKKER